MPAKVKPKAKSQKSVKGARGPAAPVSFPFGGPPSSQSLRAGRREKPSSASPLASRPKGKQTSLSISVYSLSGRVVGRMSLPKEIFGVPVNQQLLVQAVRVYSNNLKGHFAHTKTRGEIRASTRKIRPQKGSGRARHGAISAPIFVGGGIALGPKYRQTRLNLPKKMRTAALISALAQKMKDTQVIGLSDLKGATGKTKQLARFTQKTGSTSLLLTDGVQDEKVSRSVRNLAKVNFLPADQLNPYQIIKHQTLVLTKAAVDKLEERLLRSFNNKKGAK